MIWHCYGWYRPVAAALIQPLAGELPYAMGVALNLKKKKEKRKKEYPMLTVKESMFQMENQGHDMDEERASQSWKQPKGMCKEMADCLSTGR